MTAPPGYFWPYWRIWSEILEEWEAPAPRSSRPERKPFWVYTLADHELARNVREIARATREAEKRLSPIVEPPSLVIPPGMDVDEFLAYQPLYLAAAPPQVSVTRLHPLRSDAPIHCHLLVGNVPYEDVVAAFGRWPGREKHRPVYFAWGKLHYIFSQETKFWHSLDVNSYCHALLHPPFESDNLEDLAKEARRRARSKAGKATNEGKSRDWKRERALKGAHVRWSRHRRRDDQGEIVVE